MTIEEIPSASRVLIDANIPIYHATGASGQCGQLLRRAERGEVSLYMACSTYAEMLHRLMLLEARKRGLAGSNPARRVREHPEVAKSLRNYSLVGDAVLAAGVELLDLTAEILKLSQEVREDSGLLVNDSLLVATALNHAIRRVASADLDFRRISNLEVYTPCDLTG